MKSKIKNSVLALSVMLLLAVLWAMDISVPDSLSVRSEYDLAQGTVSYDTEAIECAAGNEKTAAKSGYTVARVMGIPVKRVRLDIYGDIKLIPGGWIFGAKINSDGVIIVGTGDCKSGGITVNPSKAAGLRVKDIIKSVNGKDIDTAGELTALIENSKGTGLEIEYERDGEKRHTTLTPVADENGVYRAGIWVKDQTAGIGTVTYVEPGNLRFGGLGHGISEGDTGAVLPISYGEVYGAVLTGVKKGKYGEPGEFKGFFSRNKEGILYSNTESGVFGKLDKLPASAKEPISIALKDEIKEGECTVLCMPDGKTVGQYTAQIVKITDKNAKTKNFIIKITDPQLLALTGGVVQGMSGSPVIQNGKLVGAVTHVLVNDPTRGYGIFIENMLDAAG